LVGWLDSHHQFGADGRTWDTESAVASIAGGLRHQPSGRTPDDDALLLAEQHELVEYLTGLAGVHSPLPAPPPAAESAWTTDVIRLRRNKFPQTKQIELLTEQRRIAEYLLAIARADIAESNRLLEDVYASTSWRLTKPLRSSISSLQSLRHHADEP
jgi:hypothetical protein